MNLKTIYTSILAALLIFSFFTINAENDLTNKDKAIKHKSLTLIIDNLESATAPVFVTFYTPNNIFLSETDALKFYKFIPKGKKLTVKINELNYGEYAIATYQDVNSDNEINKSFIGIPKEPYAFSNNYKPVIRAPRFDECKFVYNKNGRTVKINMIK